MLHHRLLPSSRCGSKLQRRALSSLAETQKRDSHSQLHRRSDDGNRLHSHGKEDTRRGSPTDHGLLKKRDINVQCDSNTVPPPNTSHWRWFRSSLGFPCFFAAPMVDHTSASWRQLVTEGCHSSYIKSDGNGKSGSGRGLCLFSEMLPVKALLTSGRYRGERLDWLPRGLRNSGPRSSGNSTACGDPSVATALPASFTNPQPPLIAQLAGNQLEELVQGAMLLTRHDRSGDGTCSISSAGQHQHQRIAAVDINLGCPQKCARRGAYGAYLLSEQAKVLKLLRDLSAAMPEQHQHVGAGGEGGTVGVQVPLTAKIRLLEGDSSSDAMRYMLDYVHDLSRTGISMLTVHGRNRSAIRDAVGECDWEAIKGIQGAIGGHIPVVANGGMGGFTDVRNCLDVTGAAGVMSSEGLLENPLGMFSERGEQEFMYNNLDTQLRTAERFIELVSAVAALDQAQGGGFRERNDKDGGVGVYTGGYSLFTMRNHVCKLLFRLLSGEENVDVRAKVGSARCAEDMLGVVRMLRGKLEPFRHTKNGHVNAGIAEAVVPVYDAEAAVRAGVCGPTLWYYRHRPHDQPAGL